MYTYAAKIDRVLDGDTMKIIVDVGFSIWFKHIFRVRNFDAPETRKPASLKERKHGLEAKKAAEDLLYGLKYGTTTVKVRTYKLAVYGRYECDIILPDGRDFAKVMTAEGWSKKSKY